jgi:hypothetical protein
VGKLGFDVGLGQRHRLGRRPGCVRGGVVGAEAGAFHEDRVDRSWRVGQEAVEGGGFASVAADVAGVEQVPPAGLDQQGERVVCRVVGQVRGDGERPEAERRPVAQVSGLMQVDAAAPEPGGPQDVRGSFTDEHGHVGGQLWRQSPVVLVPVADDDSQRASSVVVQSDCRR